MTKRNVFLAVTLLTMPILGLAITNIWVNPVGHSALAGKMRTDKMQHENAFVSVSFEGLVVLSINEQQRGDVGILNAPHHTLSFEIRKISPSGVSVLNYPINPKYDIQLKVDNPSSPGVTTYMNNAVRFDRKNNQGDPEDFRWVVDLEGKEFHNNQLTVANPEKFKPIFQLTHGVFYSKKLFKDPTVRVNAGSNTRPVFLGRITDAIGADIYLDRPDSAVVLRSGAKGEKVLALNREPGCRYEIIVKNLPDSETHSTQIEREGHFRYWYNAFKDPSGQKYDLQFTDRSVGLWDRGGTIPGASNFLGSAITSGPASNFGSSRFPCDSIWVSLTKKIKDTLSWFK